MEILGTMPSVESAIQAEINCVGTVFDGGSGAVPVAGRGQQFRAIYTVGVRIGRVHVSKYEREHRFCVGLFPFNREAPSLFVVDRSAVQGADRGAFSYYSPDTDCGAFGDYLALNQSKVLHHPPMSAKYPESWLAWFLWLVGVFTQLAFVAALMPASWFVTITDAIGLDAFPETPLAYYLARHLSLIYGFVGIALIVISYQLARYRDLIVYLAYGVMAFGMMQAVIDLQSGMPLTWTLGESISSVIGGLMILWLHKNCQQK